MKAITKTNTGEESGCWSGDTQVSFLEERVRSKSFRESTWSSWLGRFWSLSYTMNRVCSDEGISFVRDRTIQ